jgi:rubrerythrin
MQTTTTSHHRTSSGFQNPVDDQLYDLLQALVSKCEALEAYATYEEDADEQAAQLFRQMGTQDAEHARQLLDKLRERLNQA